MVVGGFCEISGGGDWEEEWQKRDDGSDEAGEESQGKGLINVLGRGEVFRAERGGTSVSI